jgi:putative restriction endonuclease
MSTSYWWVNQNQTFRHERAGGYLWSPKTKSNGARNHFYDNMIKVKPGDIVFSFKGQNIPAVGIILSKGYEATKPAEFGNAGANWTAVGWKVDVKYVDLKNVIRPKDHIDIIRPTLPRKYYPLRPETGDGLQSVYLAKVPDEMAGVLIGLIGAEANTIINKAPSLILSEDEQKQLEEDQVEASIQASQDIDQTEKESVVKSRRGQGLFKTRLTAIEGQCRVTKISNPNHLIASHIKPWAKCDNNQERLDGNNGLLLAPHIDHLFDKGYISFDNNGDLLISEYADLNSLAKMGVDVGKPVNVGAFNEEQCGYLEYHQEAVFKV